jgi:hypothetical protein
MIECYYRSSWRVNQEVALVRKVIFLLMTTFVYEPKSIVKKVVL